VVRSNPNIDSDLSLYGDVEALSGNYLPSQRPVEALVVSITSSGVRIDLRWFDASLTELIK